MSKKELLATHTSLELREWMAYEMHAGPLNSRWRDDIHANSNFLLQCIAFLIGAQLAGGSKDKKNKVPEPQYPTRPWALDEPEDGEEGENSEG